LQLNSDGKDEESSDDDYLGYEQVWDKEGPPIHPPGWGLKVLGKGSFGKVSF